jgi:8-oxo-dGTP diphosphatase
MRREYPERPIVAVGAAVCRKGRVLIVQRGRAPSEGVWTVPGGAVELGETMRQAAAREVKEECGIEVEVGEVVGILDHVVRDEQGRIRYHYAIVDFAARHTSGELCPNAELLGAVWITPAEFDAYGVPAKAREVFLNALNLYQETKG